MAKCLMNYKYTILTIVAMVGCFVYYYIDPIQYRFVPKCPIKLLTTLDCPGCGFQRALHAVLHGHFVEAIHYNMFLLFAIPLTFMWFANSIIIEHTSHQVDKAKMIKLNSRIIYVYILSYISWFIFRNVFNY